MVTLNAVHYVYIIMTLIILVALCFKKEIVIPCVLGIVLIGLVYTKSLIKSVQIVNNALIASNSELYSILLVIALVTAMSKAMHAAGVDEMMISPVRKVIRKPEGAFWGIGLCMLIVSLLIWPSPAVALIGALLLPVAGTVGLPALWAAVSMNIFGHGMGLSSDFFIQGAPAITSKACEQEIVHFMGTLFPLWVVMCVTTSIVAFVMMKRELAQNKEHQQVTAEYQKVEIRNRGLAVALTALITISFAAIIASMLVFHIVGGDATALVAGTALVLTCIITIATDGISAALENTVDYLKEGFIFSIRIFAPVIVIAAFFFLGSQGFAESVLGEGAPGILNDISIFISEHIPMNGPFAVIIEMVIGVITGLDGSGFSGLPLVGSVALTFGNSIGLKTEVLAALGQITTIWVGGGTVIPWGVVPVAAICGISPIELARKNIIPVAAGLAVTGIVAMFLV